MSCVTLIAAMTPKRVIGQAQQLPWHLPADLAYFKAATLGKPILMGRLTFESIGRVLPGRDNWIISSTLTEAPKGTYLASSLSAALAQLQHQPEIMVIGGGQLYQAALPLAQRMLLTIIETDITGDTLFPEWPKDVWHLVDEQIRDADSDNPYLMRFQIWTHLYPKDFKLRQGARGWQGGSVRVVHNRPDIPLGNTVAALKAKGI